MVFDACQRLGADAASERLAGRTERATRSTRRERLVAGLVFRSPTNINVTAGIYVHLLSETKRNATDAFEAYVSAAVTPLPEASSE